MISPTSRMISADTLLKDEDFDKFPSIIQRRRNELRKTKGTEEAIWLMEQLFHIEVLFSFNLAARTV